MTGKHSDTPEQLAEKRSLDCKDLPSVGAAITGKADNVAAQRLKEREALKAYRLTRDPSNAFTIDLGNGKDVKDERPISNLQPIPLKIQSGVSDSQSKPVLITFKASDDSKTEDNKPRLGLDLVKIAEKLGLDPNRWEGDTTGKCNVFVDAVYRKANIPLPWDSTHVPDCHGTREALDKECQKPNSHWHKVYVYDQAHGPSRTNVSPNTNPEMET